MSVIKLKFVTLSIKEAIDYLKALIQSIIPLTKSPEQMFFSSENKLSLSFVIDLIKSMIGLK